MNLSQFIADQGIGGSEIPDSPAPVDTNLQGDGFGGDDDWSMEPATGEQTTEPIGEPTDQNTGANDQADTFTNIDPRTLAPELQGVYKSLQGDYTRKMQAVADARRALESDPAYALVQHVNNLQSNPAALVQFLQEQTQQAIAWAASQGYQVDPAMMGQADQGQGDEDYVAAVLNDPYATENEKALAQTVQALRQELGSVKGTVQPIQQERAQMQAVQTGHQVINDTFRRFEQSFGQPLTEADKTEIATLAMQRGVQSAVDLMAVAQEWGFNKVRQAGVQAGQRVAAGKQAMAAATGAQSLRTGQTGTQAVKPGMSIREIANGVISGQIK